MRADSPSYLAHIGVALSAEDRAWLPRGALVNEETSIESHPERRDGYVLAKLHQEEIGREYAARLGFELVVARPAPQNRASYDAYAILLQTEIWRTSDATRGHSNRYVNDFNAFLADSKALGSLVRFQHRHMPLPIPLFDMLFRNRITAKLLYPYGRHVSYAGYEERNADY